jgi:hypothetical protein
MLSPHQIHSGVDVLSEIFGIARHSGEAPGPGAAQARRRNPACRHTSDSSRSSGAVNASRKSGAPAVALPKYCQLCDEAGPAATRTAVVASTTVPDKNLEFTIDSC